MAFCPNCGKSLGGETARCAACGRDLSQRPQPSKFKGTMIMGQDGAAPAPAGASKKRLGGGTMIGTGMPAATAQQGAAAATMPEPPAANLRPDFALAQTAQLGPEDSQAIHTAVAQAKAQAAAAQPTPAEGNAAARPQRAARSAYRQPAAAADERGKLPLVIGVCGMLLIAGVGYAVAHAMGLTP